MCVAGTGVDRGEEEAASTQAVPTSHWPHPPPPHSLSPYLVPGHLPQTLTPHVQPRTVSGALSPVPPPPTLSPALTPPPHAPLPVTLSGRDIWIDGVKTPLLTGLPLSLARAVPGESPGDLILGFCSASGRPTAQEDIPLGQLVNSPFLAGARAKLWWMAPAHGHKASGVPPETQFLLLELAPGGPYAALTPLIDGGTFRGTLRPAR